MSVMFMVTGAGCVGLVYLASMVNVTSSPVPSLLADMPTTGGAGGGGTSAFSGPTSESSGIIRIAPASNLPSVLTRGDPTTISGVPSPFMSPGDASDLPNASFGCRSGIPGTVSLLIGIVALGSPLELRSMRYTVPVSEL